MGVENAPPLNRVECPLEGTHADGVPLRDLLIAFRTIERDAELGLHLDFPPDGHAMPGALGDNHGIGWVRLF